MTALGKVLVFFNLLLALVTGGLIVNAFVTRTNWRKGFEDYQVQVTAAQAALKLEQSNAAQRKLDLEAQIKKLTEDGVRLDNIIKGKDEEIAREKQRKNEADAQGARAAAISNAASVEIERLQTERNQMAVQQKDLNDKLIKLTKDHAEAVARETYNKIRGDALEKELISTKEELATLKRKHEVLLARMPAGGAGATANAPRVPSIDTSGRVTGVSGNLVQISIGIDHGIEKGHILQVFRTKPDSLYLGSLTITHINPHEAVGTFEPSAPGRTVAKGDSVDTKIIR